MINFHSNRRLTDELPGDEESVLPWKFVSEWANRMNNRRMAFDHVIGGN